MRQFAAYAAPMTWGPWVKVAEYTAAVSFTISYEAVGDTLVTGKVRYFKEIGQVDSEFVDSTTITTGNVVGNAEVCFKGIPTGSAVDGTIDP